MTPKQIIAHWAEYGPGMDAVSLRNLRDLAQVALDDLIDLRLGYECREGGDQGGSYVENLNEMYDVLDDINALLFQTPF
jgi:hypothetical protein